MSSNLVLFMSHLDWDVPKMIFAPALRQTGSGKTYTMLGPSEEVGKRETVCPLFVEFYGLAVVHRNLGNPQVPRFKHHPPVPFPIAMTS